MTWWPNVVALTSLVIHSVSEWMHAESLLYSRPVLTQQWLSCPQRAEKTHLSSECSGGGGWPRGTQKENSRVDFYLLLPSDISLSTTTPSPFLPFHTYIPTISSRPAASPSPIHPPRCGHGHHSLMAIWSRLKLSQPSKASRLLHKIEALLLGDGGIPVTHDPCLFLWHAVIPLQGYKTLHLLQPHKTPSGTRILFLHGKSFSSSCHCSRLISRQTP